MRKYNLWGKYYNDDDFGEMSLDVVDLAVTILELVSLERKNVPDGDKVIVKSLEIEEE